MTIASTSTSTSTLVGWNKEQLRVFLLTNVDSVSQQQQQQQYMQNESSVSSSCCYCCCCSSCLPQQQQQQQQEQEQKQQLSFASTVSSPSTQQHKAASITSSSSSRSSSSLSVQQSRFIMTTSHKKNNHYHQPCTYLLRLLLFVGCCCCCCYHTRTTMGIGSKGGVVSAFVAVTVPPIHTTSSSVSSMMMITTSTTGTSTKSSTTSSGTTLYSTSTSSWSTPTHQTVGTTARNKRVRDILEKAKVRTGIQNVNSETTSSVVVSYMRPANTGSSSSSSNNGNRNGSSTSSAPGMKATRRYASISPSLFSLNDLDYGKVFGDSLSSSASSSSSPSRPLSVRSLPLVPNKSTMAMTATATTASYPPTVSSTTIMTSTRTEQRKILDVSAHESVEESVAGNIMTNEYITQLPFTLPDLTETQLRLLQSGQRVEEQASMSREGSGYVVMDIAAPEYLVWEALLDFEAYPDYIDTVRSMRMFTNKHLQDSYIAEKPIGYHIPQDGARTNAGTGTGVVPVPRHYGVGTITRASFVLSKFHLTIAAIHKYVPHPHGHYMEFTLDKACKNAVLQDAKGIWHTQRVVVNDSTSTSTSSDNNSKNKKDGAAVQQPITRLWLLCELQVSPMLPQFIVDYASSKAMPRATTWIQPAIERIRKRYGE